MKLNRNKLENIIAEAIDQNYQERNLANIDGIQEAEYDADEPDNPLDSPDNNVAENRIRNIVKENLYKVLNKKGRLF